MNSHERSLSTDSATIRRLVLANMIKDSKPPVTGDTGGTSVGDPSAGGSAGGGSDDGRAAPPGWENEPLGSGSRGGAAFLTFVVLVCLLIGIAFVLNDEQQSPSENWDGFRSSVSDLSVYFTSPATALAQVSRSIRGIETQEKGKDAEGRALYEDVPLKECIEILTGTEALEYQCPGCQKKVIATK